MESKNNQDYSKSAANVEVESSTNMPRRSESMFRPAVSSRATVVNRSSTSSYPATLRPQSQSRHSFAGIPSQQIVEMSSTGVTNFKEERTNEKAELQGLNSRLANYMEKMRYLEAVNKALEKELEKQKKIKDVDFDKIKNMYETELKQARKVIDDLSREKSDADVKVLSLEDEITFVKNERDHEMKDKEDYKNKAEKLADQIGDYEGKLTNLRLCVDGREDDNGKLQNTIKRLQQENARLRTDLDTETVNHINEANRAHGLEEELAFISQVYDQEIKELQELSQRDTTVEMRDFWKGEMGSALRDIQAEYDSRLNQISSTLESKYNVQLNQINSNVNRDTVEINLIKDENKKLKNKISDFNAKISELAAQNSNFGQRNTQLADLLREKEEELHNAHLKYDAEISRMQQNVESVLAELQKLMDAKLSLEMEIVAYRKLLESEEDRFDMRSKFENVGGFASANETTMQYIVKRGDRHIDQKQAPGNRVPHH